MERTPPATRNSRTSWGNSPQARSSATLCASRTWDTSAPVQNDTAMGSAAHTPSRSFNPIRRSRSTMPGPTPGTRLSPANPAPSRAWADAACLASPRPRSTRASGVGGRRSVANPPIGSIRNGAQRFLLKGLANLTSGSIAILISRRKVPTKRESAWFPKGK
jgi:hypothetical protein